MLTRRQFGIAADALAGLSCAREKGIGFEGHAFVANEDGGAIAAVNLTAFAVNLTAFAVTRHIRIEGKPTKVVRHPSLPSVWALASGFLHEIDPTRLVRYVAETLAPADTWPFPAEAVSFVLAHRERWAAVVRKDSPPLLIPTGQPGRHTPILLPYQTGLAHFRSDGKQLMLAAAAARLASDESNDVRDAPKFGRDARGHRG